MTSVTKLFKIINICIITTKQTINESQLTATVTKLVNFS